MLALATAAVQMAAAAPLFAVVRAVGCRARMLKRISSSCLINGVRLLICMQGDTDAGLWFTTDSMITERHVSDAGC